MSSAAAAERLLDRLPEDPAAVDDPADVDDSAVDESAGVGDPAADDSTVDDAATVEDPAVPDEAAESSTAGLWTTSLTVWKPFLNLTMTAVMLSQPVPSPWVSGARQCSKS